MAKNIFTVFTCNMTKILPYIKYPLAGLALTGALLYPAKANAQLVITTTVVKSDGTREVTTYYPSSKAQKTTVKKIDNPVQNKKNTSHNISEDIFVKNRTSDDIILNSDNGYTRPKAIASNTTKVQEKIFEIPVKPEVVMINYDAPKIDRDFVLPVNSTNISQQEAATPEGTVAENSEAENYGNNIITPKGTSDPEVLSKAPSPNVMIKGKLKQAKIVVDLSENVLYHYDDIGNAIKAYKIASGRKTGKKPTPTHTGIRSVSHIEYYDYKTAPSSTKRFQNPDDYGPMIIILDKLDPKTGKTSQIGEFIHGNKNKNSLGQYVSGGCMRMDNEVITYLAPLMKRGDIVLIKANKKQKL